MVDTFEMWGGTYYVINVLLPVKDGSVVESPVRDRCFVVLARGVMLLCMLPGGGMGCEIETLMDGSSRLRPVV